MADYSALDKLAAALAPEQGWNYGTVLPLRGRGQGDTEEVEFAMPGIVRGAAQGLLGMIDPRHQTAVVQAAQMGDNMPAFEDALNLAGVGGSVGMAAAPRGALAMGGARKAAKAVDDLPMDEASRMARAREMGFTEDAFHGTAANIKAFRPANKSGMSQDMVFVAKNPDFANSFAEGAGWIERGKDAGQLKGSNVMPLKVNPDGLFDASNPEHLRGLVEYVAQAKGVGVDDAARMVGGRVVGGNVDWAFRDAADYAKQAGFKGLRLNDAYNEPTIGFFDPSNIRSRFAAFDPAKADSADLLAANASPYASLAAALAQQRPAAQ